MRFGRNIAWIVLFLLAAVLVTFVFRFNDKTEIGPQEFWNYARNGQIKALKIKADQVEGELMPGVKLGNKEKSGPGFFMRVNFDADSTFAERLEKALEGKQTEYRYDEPPSWLTQIVPTMLLWIVVLGAIYFLVFRRLGQAGGGGGFLGNFGRSKHRLLTKEHTGITFKDVAGIEEAKQDVQEIVEFLRNPRKFQRLGGRIPRGLLLLGEPGCGKTLLAKAIAGEADVPFFSISGSDFVEMFVGVGASRVRDLFRQAKESAPCIIFLDEIDAVGRQRTANISGGGHDEREQTLNAILVEMDGFDTNDQVIVIGATNRADILDPALTRPGRFDRQVHVPLPDIKGRLEILKIYAAKVKCGPEVDLHRLARGTPMFSGADLAALINEATIAATMADKEYVTQADLEEARDKVRWGRARKSRAIDERERELTAYHEAGHALVQMLLPEADPLHKVSIIPRGPMGGGTFSLPEKDRYLFTRKWCEAFIRIAVAGRIAEEVFCGDADSGAAGDISQATDVARKMVMEWGMSEKLSFVRYSPSPNRIYAWDIAGKDYSERTAEMIDEEIKLIMEQAYRDARQLIQSNRGRVKALAEGLLRYETLDFEDVRKILNGQDLDKPSMNGLLDRELARTPAIKPAPRPGVDPSPGTGTIPQPG